MKSNASAPSGARSAGRRSPSGAWPASNNGQEPDFAAENIEEIVKLENRDRVKMGASDHVANRMTAFSGSMFFVLLHGLWFIVWISVNLGVFGLPTFDEFPFGLLTMIVSLEAIFLSTFVLISQNRQAQSADRRSKVDLQVNMIAEQEVTKLVKLVVEIHDHLGLDHQHDTDLKEMKRRTHVGDIADAVDAAEEKADPEAAKGPRSAADTEK